MARINLMRPGAPTAPFSVNGAVVSVAGVDIDCAAEQQDSDVIIEVRDNGGKVEIGGSGSYLAIIRVPARKYENRDVGVVDPVTGEAVMERAALPLDRNEVVVTLWPWAM